MPQASARMEPVSADKCGRGGDGGADGGRDFRGMRWEEGRQGPEAAVGRSNVGRGRGNMGNLRLWEGERQDQAQ